MANKKTRKRYPLGSNDVQFRIVLARDKQRRVHLNVATWFGTLVTARKQLHVFMGRLLTSCPHISANLIADSHLV